MIGRFITPKLEASLVDSPATLLVGARQTGKSTLAHLIAERPEFARRYFTFDDLAVFAAARHDPKSFIEALGGPAVIDEAQRVPEILYAIKQQIDRERSPGRYLLTGSANVLLLPKVSESLSGRLEVLTLWPFAQAELAQCATNFVDELFAASFAVRKYTTVSRADLFDKLLVGGYPPVLSRTNAKRRDAWFDSYLTTLLNRDVRDLANIEGLADLPRLLRLIAARSAGLLNFAEIARVVGFAQTSLKRYLTMLRAVFMVTEVPAWSSNVSKRMIRAPKLFLNDTGIAAHLLGLGPESVTTSPMLGPLLETFVHAELSKLLSWSETSAQLFHYRTATGIEVDFMIENRAGELVGIEVKASATLSTRDFQGLRNVRETTGLRFKRGVLLYTGTESVAFGPDFYALPISALWQ